VAADHQLARVSAAMTKRAALTFVLALFFMSSAAGVSRAAEYTVDSTGDQTDSAVGSHGCETALGTCTLRAAIEESNVSVPFEVSEENKIKFEFPTFDGQVAGTIDLGSPLPAITRKVRIEGSASPFQCETDYHSILGPCTGIDGPAGGAAFRISAEGVDLTGFAITGAKTAVEVLGGPGAFLWDNWFGVRLDGNAGPVETGVFVDQDSNDVRIGGVGSLERNIFADNTGAGVDIDGADFTEVLGDGFGVMPDGATPATDGTDIRVGDAPSGENRVARGNRIGRTLEAEETASPTCDGGCNVIDAATGSGIDLAGDGAGESPASGSTRIFGNYVGLDAFGTATVPDARQGVLVGSAENVTIGGPLPGDRNLVDGGSIGVRAGPDAGNLTVEGNWIGLDGTGTSTLGPPAAAGIAIEGGYQIGISENRISMLGGVAIEAAEGEALIRRNAIGEGATGEDLPGGAIGVEVTSSSCLQCGFVYGNSIANATRFGVLIEGSFYHVYANRISRAGEAGIHIQERGISAIAVRNLIGGNSSAEENTISESGGPAIEMVQVNKFAATRENVVARNNGAANGGPFIALVGGANEGIRPPQISGSTEVGASGNGVPPGATVRVFRKATGPPGEIESFLAETVADEVGGWSVSYPGSIPAGTMVAATATTAGDGTSEFAFATTTAAAPADGRDADGGGTSVSGSALPGGAPQPIHHVQRFPQTSIVKGPAKRSHSTLARFRFRSDGSAARFRCELDDGPVTDCRSPITYRRLRPGKHQFRVWAVSASGDPDPSPARWTFSIELRSAHRDRGSIVAGQH
jgi:CSLREA domain-containing protein